MLDQREKLFVDYWEVIWDREAKISYQVLTGLPIGLLFALTIVLILFSGRFWFKRADMVANSQLNPTVLMIAVVLIAGFVGIIYKRHQWDKKEQQYKELKAKENRKS